MRGTTDADTAGRDAERGCHWTSRGPRTASDMGEAHKWVVYGWTRWGDHPVLAISADGIRRLKLPCPLVVAVAGYPSNERHIRAIARCGVLDSVDAGLSWRVIADDRRKLATIAVSPGDTIEGIVELVETDPNLWTVYVEDVTTNGLMTQAELGILEGHRSPGCGPDLNTCQDLPDSDFVVFHLDQITQ